MEDENKLPPLVINLHEYKEVVKQFVSLCERLENFEFKFSDDVNQPSP